VRTVGSGGAVFPPELVRELHARFPEVRLGNGYGMSETVGLGTQTGGDLFVAVPEPVGPAQPTVEVPIRDCAGAILPEGEIGEICLRSPSVFLGYWNDPAATRAVLDENGWYRTGDYGRVAEGLLFLESRRRDMIIRGGEESLPYNETGKLMKQQLEREEKERVSPALFRLVLVDQPYRVVHVGVDVLYRRPVHHPRAQ
jgi:acyl-CoA synthetase (AMP-forming)/AMP-acid ligase II